MLSCEEYEKKNLEKCMSLAKSYNQTKEQESNFRKRLDRGFSDKDNKTCLFFDSDRLIAIAFIWALTSKDKLFNVSVYVQKNLRNVSFAGYFIDAMKMIGGKDRANLYIGASDEWLGGEFLKKGAIEKSKHVKMLRKIGPNESFKTDLPKNMKIMRVREKDADGYLKSYEKAAKNSDVRMDMWDEKTLKEAFRNPANYFMAVRDKDGDFIAVIEYSIVGKCLNINNVLVKPEYRGRGIATSLIGYVLDSAKKAAIGEIGLGVNTINKPAITLYKGLGFKTTEISNLNLEINLKR